MYGIVRTTFLTPKAGNKIEECEDAFYITPSKNLQQSKTLTVAIADGATESSFAKEWAKILTENFAGLPFPYHIGLIKKLDVLQEKWSELVGHKELPWYAEEKKQMGAFAALLGMQFNVRHRTYYCIAVGDCCFFQIRKGKIINSFPYLSSDSFSISPYLISTNPSKNENISEVIQTIEGKIKEKDIFIFLSDAASDWFIQRHENKEKPWEYLLDALICHDENEIKDSLEDIIKDQREQKLMKNDDVVIVIIEFKEHAA